MHRRTRRGKFIVLEGTDGSGKKTQFDLLIGKLREAGLPVAAVDFPQYKETLFGRLVRRYLDKEFGDVGEVSPYLASLTYAGDRWQAADKIRRWLAGGKIVIANRYRGSNEAHQAANLPEKERQAFLDFLAELELGVYQIPREDLTILLYVSPEVAQKLDAQKGEQDIHAGNLEHLREAAKMYRRFAEERDDWVMIDCSVAPQSGTPCNLASVDCNDGRGGIRSIESIHRDILEVLRSRLKINI